jgi:myo-inositol-1-phosphate synthase
VAIDAIRCVKLAMDRGICGPLESVSAFTMKSPPVQMRDTEARNLLEQWITEPAKAVTVRPPAAVSKLQ